jgi:hypothetical protein
MHGATNGVRSRAFVRARLRERNQTARRASRGLRCPPRRKSRRARPSRRSRTLVRRRTHPTCNVPRRRRTTPAPAVGGCSAIPATSGRILASRAKVSSSSASYQSFRPSKKSQPCTLMALCRDIWRLLRLGRVSGRESGSGRGARSDGSGVRYCSSVIMILSPCLRTKLRRSPGTGFPAAERW